MVLVKKQRSVDAWFKAIGAKVNRYIVVLRCIEEHYQSNCFYVEACSKLEALIEVGRKLKHPIPSVVGEWSWPSFIERLLEGKKDTGHWFYGTGVQVVTACGCGPVSENLPPNIKSLSSYIDESERLYIIEIDKDCKFNRKYLTVVTTSLFPEVVRIGITKKDNIDLVPWREGKWLTLSADKNIFTVRSITIKKLIEEKKVILGEDEEIEC